MTKTKIMIEARKEWDTSAQGITLGMYSYHNPGPWVAKIVEYVEDINKKLEEDGQTRRLIKCHISKMDGPKAEVALKGKEEDITVITNFYVAKSEILRYFAVRVK